MTAPATEARAEWLTVKEAAARAKCSDKLIYHAITAGKLRASRLGVRKDIRILDAWLDAWIVGMSTPVVINPDAPGSDPPETGPLAFNRHGRKRR